MNSDLTRKRVAVICRRGRCHGRDRPTAASELEQAELVAVEDTRGGIVTETEVDDEESEYEVEVTLDGSTQVDVQLDADFQIRRARLTGGRVPPSKPA